MLTWTFDFNFTSWVQWLIFIVDFIVRIWICARVIQRRLPASVAWAWLGLMVSLPIAGTILYWTFGEYRQGHRRMRRLRRVQDTLNTIAAAQPTDSILNEVHQGDLHHACQALFGFAPKTGNNIELLKDSDIALSKLSEDIASAQQSIDIEFYIWSDGGRADKISAEIIAAAQRGVRCRILVDAIGSSKFIKGANYRKMKQAGVKMVVALPSGIFRSLIARPDLRMHRKLVVIDDEIGYVGSMNLADPLFFHRKSKAAPWIDALARIQGPAVEDLRTVFLSDWCVETGSDFAKELKKSRSPDHTHTKPAFIQCLPSGPAVKYSSIEQALLMAIASAHTEIVFTTPYFLPSESMLYALLAAARRGVRTVLIVPARIDSRISHWASRSFFEDLLAAGVQVALYKPGLLHTKSITIDEDVSLFGSVNLDPRSLRINFEITIAIYDKDFTQALRNLQDEYLNQSEYYTLEKHEERHSLEVWAGDLSRLVGPLL
ncbi:cardiolipin synthase [Bdellovibrio sp. HCB288]|uniref:cardiolipin synthase n=1 Tax=Bdellovibrio sp. HCB288 TaxID=3394355 RepID=UPI0039B50C65